MSPSPSEPEGERRVASLYQRTVSRRAMLAGGGAALAAVGLAGCAGGGAAQAAPEPATDVYFGYVFGRPEITVIAFDIDPAAADGGRTFRAYVCDGLGEPTGLALWFTGMVDPAKVAGIGTVVAVPSATGAQTLEIGNFIDSELRGTFVDADQNRHRFISNPATDGAGIYQVTASQDLTYTGTSTIGDKLEAKLSGSVVTGTITTFAGATIPFEQEVLAFLSPDRLAQFGNSGAAVAFAGNSGKPGEYVAVVSPGGTAAYGRSGNVRRGSPGGDIIGLDASD
ncbi:MAG: hypothetical protein ACT4RN_13325 [Pseudonocardia sp.]